MSTVTSEKTEWLWNKTVPIGRPTIFYGAGENAKSLTTLEFAARLSNGEPMPGETEKHPPYSTIIVQSEDDVQSTIKPRLEVAGADMSKIHVLSCDETSFHAVNSIDQLSSAIDALRDVKLLVIDPVAEYLDGVNLWRDDDIRPALATLRRLAADQRIAVVLVGHTNKGQGTARQRMNGAETLINISRATWLFTQHPDDSETYMMLRAKGNNSKRNHLGYQFMLKDVKVFGEDQDGVPKISWLDQPATLSADDAISLQTSKRKSAKPARPNKSEQVERWLHTMLTGGPKSRKELIVLAREHFDVSDITVDRVKTKIGITTNRLGLWELPSRPVPA